jgi:hypothetical protein
MVPLEVSEKICHNSPKITVPNIRRVHKLVKEVRSTGSLLDKKLAKKNSMYVLKKTRQNRGYVRASQNSL